MDWYRAFKAQGYGRPTYKDRDYPIWQTDEFDFYRCVKFDDRFYGKTASELFSGNLRYCSGRYSSLFPNQKVSYWANSPKTARAEIKKHGAGNDILTFWAYDDGSSTFPIMESSEFIKILDGRQQNVRSMMDKLDEGGQLSEAERIYMDGVFQRGFDAIAYESHAYPRGENYIFLESGFKKLALREIKLRFGRKHGGNHATIVCAGTCDYNPYIESYGDMFLPKARIGHDSTYDQSEECLQRAFNKRLALERRHGGKR